MSGVGVFGGTFDPIHNGHLRSALELQQALALDEVRFVPCRQPPHRMAPVAGSEARAEMVERAITGVEGFVLDRRELHREGPSYTLDTLAALRREMPEERLVLLLGTDAFLGLPGWHGWRALLELAHIAVAHRPGWSLEDGTGLEELTRGRLVAEPGGLNAAGTGRIVLVAVTQLEISATALRSTASMGGDIHFLVPEVVREYIEKTGCYRQG